MNDDNQLGLFQSESVSAEINKKSSASHLGQNPSMQISIQGQISKSQFESLLPKVQDLFQGIDQDLLLEGRHLAQPHWKKLPFIALDIETTGLNHHLNRIIEVAWIHFRDEQVQQTSAFLCNIQEPLPKEIIQLTGISDDMLKKQPAFAQVADQLIEAVREASFVVAYNVKFDKPFIEAELARLHRVLPSTPWIDPFIFINEIDRFKRGKKLTDAAKRWGIPFDGAHRATADALATGKLLYKLADFLEAFTLPDLIRQQTIWFYEQARSFEQYRTERNNGSNMR